MMHEIVDIAYHGIIATEEIWGKAIYATILNPYVHTHNSKNTLQNSFPYKLLK